MLRKSSSPLIGETALACRSDLRVTSGASSAPSVSLMVKILWLTPPPAESIGNQGGPPLLPRSEAQADVHTPTC